MKHKKTLALMLALIMALMLTGCGEVKPIPYKINFTEDESFAYDCHNLQEEYLGKIEYTYSKSGSNWTVKGLFENENGNIEYGVTVSPDTLSPVSSYRIGHPKDENEQVDWYYKATYSESMADIENMEGANTQSIQIDIGGRCFDAECLPMILRGFDLSEDFSADFYFVNTYSGSAIEANAKVTGIEEINGKPCYSLYLSTVELISNPLMTVFYTADDDKVPMRIEQKSSTFDLIN